MTDEELQRLPPLMREIVLADRAAEERRAAPVVNFAEAIEAKKDLGRLRAAAAQLYTPGRSGTDGKSQA